MRMLNLPLTLDPDLTLVDLLNRSFSENSQEVALRIEDEEYTYEDLNARCSSIISTIHSVGVGRGNRIAILASRSISAYTAILSAIMAGASYVPLSNRMPFERIIEILQISGCKTIIVGEECVETFNKIAGTLCGVNILCLSGSLLLKEAASRFDHLLFSFFYNKLQSDCSKSKSIQISADDEAYVIFTSGTTGRPKGVPVKHKNLVSFLLSFYQRYQIGPGDNYSQFPDLTFDASVKDVFLAFSTGAKLCVIPEISSLAPAFYIKKYNLTVWHSVPSVVMFMEKFKMLEFNSFPSLRHTFFGGEALTFRTVCLWQNAAPNSQIENSYGPTETTITASLHRVEKKVAIHSSGAEIVPIGQPLLGVNFSIRDEQQNECKDNQSGELWISGSQVVDGYLDDEAMTEKKFIKIKSETYYRSGDIVSRDIENIYYYHGRIDDQIQLRGFRVELQEIDRAIREGAMTDLAVALPIGFGDGRADSVCAVVQGAKDIQMKRAILAHCREVLLDYMVPTKVLFVENFPLTVSGKIDRKELYKQIP